MVLRLDEYFVSGFNIQGALKRLDNDGMLLSEVIAEAIPQLIDSVELVLKKLLGSPLEKETLVFELHALAGCSANIGAETISTSARRLEQFLKGTACTKSYLELLMEFEAAASEFIASLQLLDDLFRKHIDINKSGENHEQ